MTGFFDAIFGKCRGAFKQGRTFERAFGLARGIINCVGRCTVTGMLAASGRQFKDWTAAYRLFGGERMDMGTIFGTVRKELIEQHLTAGDDINAHMDDTTFIMEHRGEIVLKILTQKGINKTEMADKLNVKRQTLYNQLENANMKTHYILKIGEVLDYDFSEVIPSLKKELKELPTTHTPEKGSDNIETDELDVTIHLDGTEETLQKIIQKLTCVNEAIRAAL